MSSAAALTPLIRFDGVWKKFQRGEVHDSLRDLVPALARRALGLARTPEGLRHHEFWAVRDLSFSVAPGQTLGIIGHNGAGKSTVLKLLTRILRPTRGSFLVRGRVGALIEIAAGFHPDLTGRENIFLQGAIMGMGHAQTRRKLDEIIAFSDVEEFIDTPVKRYSSGMNARLGFSIAAHLDPDVLIIDEVLAVGDYTFQRKAFGRVRELARSGMPVVVVSHQLDRVAELCTDVLLLSRGQVRAMGSAVEVIGTYMRGEAPDGDAAASPSPIVIQSAHHVGSNEVRSGEPVCLRIRGSKVGELSRHVEPVGVVVRSAQSGDIVYATGSSLHEVDLHDGDFALDVELRMNVQPGIYLVDVGVFDRASERWLHTGASVTIRVTEGLLFMGSANLNAAMRLQPRGARLQVPA